MSESKNVKERVVQILVTTGLNVKLTSEDRFYLQGGQLFKPPFAPKAYLIIYILKTLVSSDCHTKCPKLVNLKSNLTWL